MITVAHLSDLHFGAHEPPLVDGLLASLAALAPDVTVVSGDLTQRARRSQFHAARAFLDRVPEPWLAVPGNHDIPLYDVARRALAPRDRFHALVTPERQPLLLRPGLRVLGLDTTRPERWATGRVRPRHLPRLDELAAGEPGDLRILVTHHPFVGQVVSGHAAALDAAALAGVDVLLAGHLHVGLRGRILEYHPDARHGMLVVLAGTATSYRRRRGEANSFNVLRHARDRLDVELWTWDGARFAASRTDRFTRGTDGWHAVGGDARQPSAG